MKKMPTLFKLKYDSVNNKKRRTLLKEVNEQCQWVLDGEGIPYIKIDGTSCLIQDGKIYRRYDAKNGKVPPEGAIPCQKAPDPITGHFPHWLLCKESDPEAKYHLQALSKLNDKKNGTYELVGLHFVSNPYDLTEDILIKHDDPRLLITDLKDRSYEGLREYLSNHYIEGIVFHRENGDMCKIKRADYGFEWKKYKCLPKIKK